CGQNTRPGQPEGSRPQPPRGAAASSPAFVAAPQAGAPGGGPKKKPPAASATGANRTAAPRAILVIVVIVGPPRGRSHATIVFGALSSRCHSSTRLSTEKSRIRHGPPKGVRLGGDGWAAGGPGEVSRAARGREPGYAFMTPSARDGPRRRGGPGSPGAPAARAVERAPPRP